MSRAKRSRGLQSWLDAATDGLCDAAKERISDEIRGHYAEAKAAEMARGRCEDEAHRIALAALGDAKRARKAFRRTYLTEKEAKTLARVANPSELMKDLRRLMKLVVLFLLFHLGWLVYEGTQEGAVNDWLLVVSTASVLVCNLILLWICPGLVEQRRWRRCIAWQLVAVVTFCFATPLHVLLSWMDGSQEDVVPLFYAAVVAVPATWAIGRVTPLLRKLGNHTELYDSFLNGDDGGRHA